jgi:hypothetical protein
MTEYLTGLRRLPPGFDADAHLARLDEDGFTILENYMSEDQLTRFREGLRSYLVPHQPAADPRSDETGAKSMIALPQRHRHRGRVLLGAREPVP